MHQKRTRTRTTPEHTNQKKSPFSTKKHRGLNPKPDSLFGQKKINETNQHPFSFLPPIPSYPTLAPYPKPSHKLSPISTSCFILQFLFPKNSIKDQIMSTQRPYSCIQKRASTNSLTHTPSPSKTDPPAQVKEAKQSTFPQITEKDRSQNKRSEQGLPCYQRIKIQSLPAITQCHQSISFIP